MYSAGCEAGITGSGFPHSDIPGSKLACSSPRLFAACHVLHRLLAPRHPPYALSSLTIKLTQHVVPIRPFPRGCLLVLRKLAFPQIAPPAIPPARTNTSVCARRNSGGLLEQNLQLSDLQTVCTDKFIRACGPLVGMPAYSVVKEPSP